MSLSKNAIDILYLCAGFPNNMQPLTVAETLKELRDTNLVSWGDARLEEDKRKNRKELFLTETGAKYLFSLKQCGTCQHYIVGMCTNLSEYESFKKKRSPTDSCRSYAKREVPLPRKLD